jgi:hypothetical protein
MQSSSAVFMTGVKKLLAERAALRPLLASYKYFLGVRNYNPQRTNLEHEIASIITAPLPFDEEERRYHLPQPEHLATAAFYLRTMFSDTYLQDKPQLVWDMSPVPGISTVNWHPVVKQRLMDLTGTLDETLQRSIKA